MAAELQAVAVEYRARRQAEVPEGAGTPEFVAATPACAPEAAPKREVWDAQQGSDLPGPVLARNEGDAPTGDQEVDEAYDGAGDTYDLYASQYGRDSLDGRGMKLVSSVHVRRNFNNAYWNGIQMAYGDGDEQIFVPLTRSLSVIGHELSHGVVQFSGGLVYKDQPGALNESFADVFGVLVEQKKRGEEAHEAHWLVGNGILAPGVNGEALRSVKAPGTAYDDPMLGRDPQPFHMDDYNATSDDNGGVHINSGIPNHAFYLVAQYLGGRAWEKAGHIWYDALQAVNNPHAQFAEWAEQTVAAAWIRFGAGSIEERFTRRAWKLVGVL